MALQDTPRIDKQLADILQGEVNLEPMDHEEKVVTLASLYELWSATDAVGWHQHTGDWDWQCEVSTASATYTCFGTCYSIDWGGTRTGPPHTACVDSHMVKFIHMPHEEEGMEETTVDLFIDNIKKVRFEEL